MGFSFSRHCTALIPLVVAGVMLVGSSAWGGIVVDLDNTDRLFTWGANRTPTEQDDITTSDAYTRTVDGITQASTAFTDSGFTITTTGSSPTAGTQWTQYLSISFQFTEDTAITMSGTLYSPPPYIDDGYGYQYIYMKQGSFAGPTIYEVPVGGSSWIDGPQPFSYSGTLLANTTYIIEANTSWANPVDGGTQTFINLTATAVPEPSTYAMALAGLAYGGYSVFRRRKRA